MLRHRVLSSVVLIPILLVSIWFGSPWFSIVVIIAALLGIVEFYNMFAQELKRPQIIFGAILTLLFLFNSHYAHSYGSESTQTAVTSTLLASALILTLLFTFLLNSSREQFLFRWSWTLAGILYIGWLMSYWILLMNYNDHYDWTGRDWVLLTIFSTFAVDTTAYFVGQAIGKHKLAPSISPGKTWEGAFGGLVGAVLAVCILALPLDINIGYSKLVFIGFAVGVFAQLGDLLESKLKRTTGVKESGNIIPGHGGILDRLDSVVLTGAVVYYCLRWFIG